MNLKLEMERGRELLESKNIEIIRQDYSDFEKIATPSHIELIRSYIRI